MLVGELPERRRSPRLRHITPKLVAGNIRGEPERATEVPLESKLIPERTAGVNDWSMAGKTLDLFDRVPYIRASLPTTDARVRVKVSFLKVVFKNTHPQVVKLK